MAWSTMIIKTKKEEFESYLEDTSNLKGNASSLYIPQTLGEINDAIRNFYIKKTPFTVVAGKTGTTAGCVAQEGVIMSVEMLNKIIDIDKTKKMAYLQAGASFKDLEEEARKFNLSLLASPTESLALVSGAISTCASGVRGFGYGSIRNYISTISVVLPTGEILEIERGKILANKRVFDFQYSGKSFKFNLPHYTQPSIKSQAGYFVKDNMDLIDLFIGSEGTLGVVTSCKLRLSEIPENVFDGLIFFKKEQDGLEFIVKIKKFKNVCPASLEFFDRNSLRMLKEKYSFIPDAACAVYFEQTVGLGQDYNSLMDNWISSIEEYATFSDNNILADTVREREKVFEFRHKLPQLINEFLRQHSQLKASLDCAVPFEKILEMYNFYKEKGENCGIDYVNFGHIGEAHLHFNFLPKNDEQSLKAKKYMEIFCKKALTLGGTISAEHGIGKIKKPFLKLMYNKSQIEEMARLKKYFDPACLMGLDNIFEKEILFKV
jgi:D-lactate dehydrogenase (cytochrome)